MGELLALASAVLWGTADFLGGTLTRRLRPLLVVSFTVPASVPFLVVLALATGAWHSGLGYLPWALAAGPVTLLAIGTFYRALAIGTMGLVSPVAATGVVVPLAVGLLSGTRPGAVAMAGLLLAVAGMIAVSAAGPEPDEPPPVTVGRAASARTPLLLGFLAGLGFGFVIVALGEGAHTSVLMTLLVMRLTSAVVLVVTWLALRQRPSVGARDLAALVVVGCMDAGANAVYGLAVRHGVLAVVAVLGSLYPVATVLLGRQVHGERLRPVQLGGMLLLLAAVPMITVG